MTTKLDGAGVKALVVGPLAEELFFGGFPKVLPSRRVIRISGRVGKKVEQKIFGVLPYFF